MGVRSRNLDQTHSECDWNLEEILLQVQMLSPSSMEDQKKNVFKKIEGILSPNLIEDQKKKRKKEKKSTPQYSAGIGDLFVLTAAFSSNHPNAYSQWRECWNIVRENAEISMEGER